MLARLTPDQVSEFWEVIKVAVDESRPPQAGDGPDRDNNILEALLEQRMDCWMDYSTNGAGPVLNLILLTTVTEDACAGTRQLLIYSIYGWRKVSMESWAAGLEKLKAWGQSIGCDKVVAYTNSPPVLNITKKLGFRSDYQLLSVDCV